METPRRRLIAAHRFGLAEASLQTVGDDPKAWLLSQIGPADAQRGDKLPDSLAALRAHADFVRERRSAKRDDTRPPALPFVNHFRELVRADTRARLLTAATTQRAFAERLALFWSNHFTVSMAKASARGFVGAFEREAVRPHIAGSFETLLKASVKHAAMLRYLDNDQSAGPDSRYVQRRSAHASAMGEAPPRITGLNENLARELMELHTLGADSGYTQTDVTEFARVLTGWRTPGLAALEGDAAPTPVVFDAAWHEPGPKTVLGRRYAEGPQALDEVLHDLAQHPATAHFIATKLTRHFVADNPPPAVVARLASAYKRSEGDLPTLYRTLIDAPETWAETAPKLKTPEEFVISSTRLLGLGDSAFERAPDGGTGTLGQRVQAAPSPAGWPDRAEDWLGPDAVWKRVEWATRVGARSGRQTDARALAVASLGPGLSESTTRQLQRAADGTQAVALLLLAPEFQRR